MDAREKTVLKWGAVIAGVLLLIWLLLRNRGSQVTDAGPSFTLPNYLTYNYPVSRDVQGSASGLPTVGQDIPDCGCGCSPGMGQVFASFSDLLNSFGDQAKSIFGQYESTVLSHIPNTVSQYFINPTGAGAGAPVFTATDPAQVM